MMSKNNLLSALSWDLQFWLSVFRIRVFRLFLSRWILGKIARSAKNQLVPAEQIYIAELWNSTSPNYSFVLLDMLCQIASDVEFNSKHLDDFLEHIPGESYRAKLSLCREVFRRCFNVQYLYKPMAPEIQYTCTS